MKNYITATIYSKATTELYTHQKGTVILNLKILISSFYLTYNITMNYKPVTEYRISNS